MGTCNLACLPLSLPKMDDQHVKKNKDTVKHVINYYSFVINLRLHLHSLKIL